MLVKWMALIGSAWLALAASDAMALQVGTATGVSLTNGGSSFGSGRMGVPVKNVAAQPGATKVVIGAFTSDAVVVPGTIMAPTAPPVSGSVTAKIAWPDGELRLTSGSCSSPAYISVTAEKYGTTCGISGPCYIAKGAETNVSVPTACSSLTSNNNPAYGSALSYFLPTPTAGKYSRVCFQLTSSSSDAFPRTTWLSATVESTGCASIVWAEQDSVVNAFNVAQGD